MASDRKNNILQMEKRVKTLKEKIQKERKMVKIEKARLMRSGHEALGKAIIKAFEQQQIEQGIINRIIKEHVKSDKDLSILISAGIYQTDKTEEKNSSDDGQSTEDIPDLC